MNLKAKKYILAMAAPPVARVSVPSSAEKVLGCVPAVHALDAHSMRYFSLDTTADGTVRNDSAAYCHNRLQTDKDYGFSAIPKKSDWP